MPQHLSTQPPASKANHATSGQNEYVVTKAGRSTATICLILVLGFIAGFLFYLNRSLIFDWFASLSFRPTATVSELEGDLNLTSRAKLIFAASDPQLQDRDDFNESCSSHDQEVSVLGCYGKNHIYIYNVTNDELDGVIQSTAAHELLHAAWQRLAGGEKNRLAALLNSVYEDDKYHARLAEDLEIYDDTERIEELHSRIGTEIADLPEELEKHYANYFVSQDQIVGFYDSYITPFQELEAEIDAISEELEKLDVEITEKTNHYYQTADALSAKIDEFNNCANTPNCFATDAIFYARRNQLVAEQDALETEYQTLSTLVDKYNSLVEKYNDNVVRGENLESIINSNKTVEELKE